MSKQGNKRKSKTARRSRPAGSRNQAALDALMTRVEGLMNGGDDAAALAALETALPQLGHHAEVRALLATLLGQQGRYMAAVRHARVAVEQQPGFPGYHALLAMSYWYAGFFSLAYRTNRAYQKLDPQGSVQFPISREIETVQQAALDEIAERYGLAGRRAADDAAYHMDLGRWALNEAHYRDALRESRVAARLAPVWPTPRNNATLALFFLGQVSAAQREAEDVLAHLNPANVHALANLIRCHLALGRRAEAVALGQRLATLPLPDALDDAIKLIEGLGLLDLDQPVAERVALLRKGKKERPILHLYGGIAAANLGRRREALATVRRAVDADPHWPLAVETLAALEEKLPGRGIAERYTYTHFSDWITRDALDEIIVRQQRAGEDQARSTQAWRTLAARYDQLPYVLAKIMYETDRRDVEANHALVIALARIGTQFALELLREFATGRAGPDEERVFALHQLQAAGALPESGGVTMWLDGEAREVQPLAWEIDDDPFDYADAALDHYEAAQEAHHAGRLDAAVTEYEAALALEPRLKEAHHNLAAIYGSRDDQAAADRHLDHALAIDSVYAFPLCARALQAASAGDMEKARRWLKPLSERKRWRPAELEQYLMTMVRLALQEKQFDEARKYLAVLQELAPDDPQVADLELTVRVSRLGQDAGAWFKASDERFRQRRQKKPLPADPTLADCLRHLSGDDMTAIAEVLGLGPVYKYKVNERREFLAQALLDPATIQRAMGELNATERSALAELLAAGGSVPRVDFVRTYGDDSDERPYMLYHAKSYKSVLGRLRARGLIYEGAIGAVQVVVLPRELHSINV